METHEKIWIATKYVEKGYDGESLYYGDDLYNYKGQEKEAIYDEILAYMEEYKNLGRHAFKEKYPSVKMY